MFFSNKEVITLKKRKVLPMFRKTFPVLILFATLLISIGYASVNSVLIGFNGTAIVKETSGVYITEVNYVSNNNADTTILIKNIVFSFESSI